MLGELRAGADYFNGVPEEVGAVGDRSFLHLLPEAFEQCDMIGAGFLQSLEPLGGNTCRTQISDCVSGRAEKPGNVVTGAK